MQALCAQTYIPLRAAASDSAEMVSQLLFGETCHILQDTGKWANICCDYDGYTGWVYKPVLTILTEHEYAVLEKSSKYIVDVPILIAQSTKSHRKLYITVGSTLYNLEASKQTFSVLDQHYTYTEPLSQLSSVATPGVIITETAKQLVNVPYLWGGRSTFGIDCSGLVQTCYKIAGIPLPRDAAQQAEMGSIVTSHNDIRPADLAFFHNHEGKIIHVGILLSSSLIVHASNTVQINAFDNHGIRDTAGRNYTHRLAFIKRVI